MVGLSQEIPSREDEIIFPLNRFSMKKGVKPEGLTFLVFFFLTLVLETTLSYVFAYVFIYFQNTMISSKPLTLINRNSSSSSSLSS